MKPCLPWSQWFTTCALCGLFIDIMYLETLYYMPRFRILYLILVLKKFILMIFLPFFAYFCVVLSECLSCVRIICCYGCNLDKILGFPKYCYDITDKTIKSYLSTIKS